MSYVGNTNTTQAFTPAVDYFSGDGSTVAFTLSRPVASTAQVQAVVNNVPQNPTDAFTVLNNTITFTSAPSSGTNNIYVQYTSPITQVIQPGQGTVTSNSFGLITDFTTTGNTVLGNASTDTLNVGNGGLVKDASGNVGIGVTPSAWGQSGTVQALQIKNTSLAGSGNNAYWGANWYGGGFDKYIANGYASLAIQTAGGHYWFTAPSGTAGNAITFTQAMTLDSSGNLLVGTTDNSGTARFTLAQSSGNRICRINSVDAGTVEAVQFVKTSGGAAQVGSITMTTTATAYNTSSDYRLKHDVAPMTGALAKVQQLKPVTYKWNADDSNGEGFIAHELQAVMPDAVVGEKDAVDAEGNPVYQGIDTSFLVATLTAAIQELKAINDAQAETITALTARVTALESK